LSKICFIGKGSGEESEESEEEEEKEEDWWLLDQMRLRHNVRKCAIIAKNARSK
jgi:hypothetical protein